MFTLVLQAQVSSDKKDVSVFAEAGYLVGGQITPNTFLYQSGFSGRVGIMKEVSETFSLGLGSGLDQYATIDFFPVYLHFRAKKSPEKNGYFSAFGGYSFTNEKSTGVEIKQHYDGGAFLEVGRAWSYVIGPKMNFTAGLFLKHQFAVSEVENQVGDELDENVNFDTVQFRIGINLR